MLLDGGTMHGHSNKR